MRCSALRGAVLALALLSLPMLGCEIKTIKIQLPGFADGTINGIVLLRQAPGQSSWTRACTIQFQDLRYTHRGETLFYVQDCVPQKDGTKGPGLVLPAVVERLPGDPATITVELYYLRYEDPGSYKAIAVNDYGESPPSAGALPL